MASGVVQFVNCGGAPVLGALEGNIRWKLDEVMDGGVKGPVAPREHSYAAGTENRADRFGARPRGFLDGWWRIWRNALHLRYMKHRIMTQDGNDSGSVFGGFVVDLQRLEEENYGSLLPFLHLPALVLGLLIRAKSWIGRCEGKRIQAKGDDVDAVIRFSGCRIERRLGPNAF